jgi:hypothetical protein
MKIQPRGLPGTTPFPTQGGRADRAMLPENPVCTSQIPRVGKGRATMLVAPAACPVHGTMNGFAGDNLSVMDTGRSSTTDGPTPNLFGQLVALYQSNEYLLSELKSVTRKLSRSRAALDPAGTRQNLARAHFDHLKAKHSAALLLLRANRLQVRTLLTKIRAGAGPTAV